MILKITTEYIGVDKKWFDWWLRNNAKNYKMFPHESSFPHTITDKDPDSGVWATTKIELLKSKLDSGTANRGDV